MPRRSRSGGLRLWSDGFGDILIGADGAGSSNQGEAYLVFGNATGGSFNLSALNGTNGCESRMAVMSAAWFVEFRQRLPWLLHVD